MADPAPHPPSAEELSGKIAVVSGSSSGLGRAIAVELARGGADIVVHARKREDEAKKTAEAVRSLGRRCEAIILDLADADNHEQFVDRAWSCFGAVDIWVNNAGADVLTGQPAQTSFEEKLDLLWQVDVLATIRLSRLAGQRMKKHFQQSGDGVIINMGWDQAEHGMEGDSGEMFAAVKGAVMAFSKSLARSLAPQVRVNCLAPGWIKTAWGQQASDQWQQRAQQQSLLERWGEPEDVAQVARFLASPSAGFITGCVVPINGGLRHL